MLENPSYEEVCSGGTDHAEVVLVVFDPAATPYAEMLRLFWEGHDPTQGNRQGNDRGTQYRSLIATFGDAQREQARSSAEAYGKELQSAGYGPITTQILRRAEVLVRRGVSPAVPGQEPVGLLRHRRHRRSAAGYGVVNRCTSP